MSNNTTREALVRDIKAAITELAAGANYPDLLDAIDALAASAPSPQAVAAAVPDVPRPCLCVEGAFCHSPCESLAEPSPAPAAAQAGAVPSKLESIISGHKINEDDADWLRAMCARSAPAETAVAQRTCEPPPAKETSMDESKPDQETGAATPGPWAIRKKPHGLNYFHITSEARERVAVFMCLEDAEAVVALVNAQHDQNRIKKESGGGHAG